jgi:hypothetical protein
VWLDTAAEHKGFFSIEADTTTAVIRVLGLMTVDVRPVQILSEVAKTS